MQPLPDASDLRVGEPGTAMADVVKPAGVIVDAKQQGAEKGARSTRIGPAADDTRLAGH